MGLTSTSETVNAREITAELSDLLQIEAYLSAIEPRDSGRKLKVE